MGKFVERPEPYAIWPETDVPYRHDRDQKRLKIQAEGEIEARLRGEKKWLNERDDRPCEASQAKVSADVLFPSIINMKPWLVDLKWRKPLSAAITKSSISQ